MKRTMLIIFTLMFFPASAFAFESFTFPGVDDNQNEYVLVIGRDHFVIIGAGLPLGQGTGYEHVTAAARDNMEMAARNAMLATLLQATVPGNSPVVVNWAVTQAEAQLSVGGAYGHILSVQVQ